MSANGNTSLPQPREGITGTLRDQDDLLSLDDKAFPRREMMVALALVLQRTTLVGDPAPVVDRIGKQINDPQPGDLVVETTSIGRSDTERRAMGFGILLAYRDEWAQTDEEYNQELADNGDLNPGWRAKDHAWYVQYGPQPDDICRWVNCCFITIPTDRDFGRIPVGTQDDKGITITRDDLVGGLADAGFTFAPNIKGE
jgi:hypothetical protein